jgi:hypothetical protein
MNNGKWYIRESAWPNFKQYRGICLEGLRKAWRRNLG